MLKLLVLTILIIALLGCGGGQNLESRVTGKWAGTSTEADGEPMTITVEFVDDGQIVMVVSPNIFDLVVTGTWHVDDDDNLCIDTGEGGGERGGDCTTVEFIGDDTVRITGNTKAFVLELVRDE